MSTNNARTQKDTETREIARSQAWKDRMGLTEPEKPKRSLRDVLERPDVAQCSVSESNSQKESVPLHQDSAEQAEKAEQAALLKIAKGDQEMARKLGNYLQQQIAERYTSAIALEQAAQMIDAVRAKIPSPEVQARKRRITPTDAIMEDVLDRYRNGLSISRMCKEDPALPEYSTVVTKLNSPEWKERYMTARMHRTDKMAEELTEATNELNRLVAVGASSEIVNAMKLHVNTLQWVMARMNPGSWGDRQTVDLTANIVKKETDVDAALIALLTKAGVAPPVVDQDPS